MFNGTATTTTIKDRDLKVSLDEKVEHHDKPDRRENQENIASGINLVGATNCIINIKVTVYSVKCVGRINNTICFFSNRNKEFQLMCCGSNTTFCTCLFSVKNNNCSWVRGPQWSHVLQKRTAKNQTNRLLNPHNFNTSN